MVNLRRNDLHTGDAKYSHDTMSVPQERERGVGASKCKIEARQKLQNFSTNDGIHQNR